MTTVVAVGAQWGDEGKGKIVDWLAPSADLVARFQGGNNAGHTLVVDGEKTVLHIVPSGILHPGSVNLIGPGVVVDPSALLTELDALMAVYGPSSTLQSPKAKERQTHQDVGSDGGESSGVKDGAPKDMPRHVKDHYDGLISKGMYKGWSDPALKSEVETYGGRWK